MTSFRIADGFFTLSDSSRAKPANKGVIRTLGVALCFERRDSTARNRFNKTIYLLVIEGKDMKIKGFLLCGNGCARLRSLSSWQSSSPVRANLAPTLRQKR